MNKKVQVFFAMFTSLLCWAYNCIIGLHPAVSK